MRTGLSWCEKTGTVWAPALVSYSLLILRDRIRMVGGARVVAVRQTAGPFDKLRAGSSTAPLAIRLREASLRMTLLRKESNTEPIKRNQH